MSRDALADALAGIVGPDHVLRDAELKATYETDWTRRFRGRARLVVRPADTAEVAAVVAVCRDEGVPIVPQGGNTGLVGGGVPRDGEVLVSMSRLDSLEPVDTVAGQVTARAGVTLERLQRHARDAGYEFALDHAARSAATVGGSVATNAGGIHAIRHGSMRHQTVGVEAVLANGDVIERLAGLVKDNAGYDLPDLIAGSEGTLAIVTAARLRLAPHMSERVTALFAVTGAAAAVDLYNHVSARVRSLEAAELFFANGLDLVVRERRLPPPFSERHPAYLLVECAGTRAVVDELADAARDAPGVVDEAVADDSGRRAALWAYRESHTEAINARGVPHKLDVTVPLARLAEFVDAVEASVAELEPGAEAILFGHVGDGNLHVNVIGPTPDDDRVDDAVLRLVAEHHGSVSAEHGIGTAKVRWLGLTRSRAEIAAMEAIKHALDPDGLLNPGVLLPRGPAQPPPPAREPRP